MRNPLYLLGVLPGLRAIVALAEAEEHLRATARILGADEGEAVARAREYAQTMPCADACDRVRRELSLGAHVARATRSSGP